MTHACPGRERHTKPGLNRRSLYLTSRALKTILQAAACAWFSVALFVGRAADLELGTPNMGERLFLETRFSQFFFTNSGGNPNFVLTNGDPVMDTTESIYGPMPGSFAGRAMNCRAC